MIADIFLQNALKTKKGKLLGGLFVHGKVRVMYVKADFTKKRVSDD